ncbi:hypothetical protein [Roseateles noduli]|uniref:hypothetical protein n=1 Tax=Roseateles noduli TaxID=2052484 RepID=UPI003D64B99A
MTLPSSIDRPFALRVAKDIVDLDPLLASLPRSLAAHKLSTLRDLAEELALQSEALRLEVLLDRPIQEHCDTSQVIVLLLRRLQDLARRSRVAPLTMATLQLSLRLADKIHKNLALWVDAQGDELELSLALH